MFFSYNNILYEIYNIHLQFLRISRNSFGLNNIKNKFLSKNSTLKSIICKNISTKDRLIL